MVLALRSTLRRENEKVMSYFPWVIGVRGMFCYMGGIYVYVCFL